MALVGEGNQGLDGSFNLYHHAVGGIKVVLGYKLPNGIEVNLSFGVKLIPDHRCSARRAALLARSRANTSSPEIGFTAPLSKSS